MKGTINPWRILLYLTMVFGLVFLLALVFPEGGISLGGDLQLRFASVGSYFQKDTVEKSYVDSLIDNAIVSSDPEFETDDTLLILLDSLLFQQEVAAGVFDKARSDSIIRHRIDSISKHVHPIEMSEKSRGLLEAFFKNAENSLDDERLIRVLHYGDSQIENDRMTSLLRYRLQRMFGGSGCGLVPAIPLYFGNPTFRERYEGNWLRYTGFGQRDSLLDHNYYGLMACFTEIPPYADDEIPALEFQFVRGRRASSFMNIKYFLDAYSDEDKINLQINDSIFDTLQIVHRGYQQQIYSPEVIAEKLRMEFHFREGGRMYGLAFDPLYGLQVDNIAMRGSSGLELSRTNTRLLDTMAESLNPQLILMQFGGNVVPYINNVNYYKRRFSRELRFIRELMPGASVIVIGPSDMASKENGRFETYPMLEPVRDVLRDAALENGCHFWDMYQAMGGRESIKNFVMADPPLASSDYIHFTARGANLMAGMFFDALMLEYNNYKVKSGP